MRISLMALAVLVMSTGIGTAVGQVSEGNGTPEELRDLIANAKDVKGTHAEIRNHCVWLARGLIIQKADLEIFPVVRERCNRYDILFPEQVKAGRGIFSTNGDEYPQRLPSREMTPAQ